MITLSLTFDFILLARLIESYNVRDYHINKRDKNFPLNLSLDLQTVPYSKNDENKLLTSVIKPKKDSGTSNTPKNIIKKSRYLTPLQFIRSTHNPKIYGSKYHNTEQYNNNDSILISEGLMNINTSSDLKEKLKIHSEKESLISENKILKSFDSSTITSNNDIEYIVYYIKHIIYVFFIRIEQKSSRKSRQEGVQNHSVILNSTYEGT